ncbi:hypothetical protein [Microcella sp.]|uniref:hypothetical protein n=1 Tax=Microcella sp. TaxID=1913979 RepID=UPI00256736E5|nr:hypothetical protein [Microcella sp.]MBX9471562.1 hypothetical protein [Microcella sp.]
MTRTVAIVCAAGVASTFLARALREQLAQHELDWSVEPLAVDQLPSRAAELSIVLVGHHLAAHFVAVRDGLAETGVPAHLLDSDDHASAARQALALLLAHDSRSTVSSPLDS